VIISHDSGREEREVVSSLPIFNQVRLDSESGTLVWPNEADFDPATLHDWDRVGEAMIKMAESWPEPPVNHNLQTGETVRSNVD